MSNPEQPSSISVSPELKAIIDARRAAQQAGYNESLHSAAPQAPPSIPPQSRTPRPRSGEQPAGNGYPGYRSGGQVPGYGAQQPRDSRQRPSQSEGVRTRTPQQLPAEQYSSGIDTAHHASVQREGGWFHRHPRTTIGVIAAAVVAGGLYFSGHEGGEEAGPQAAAELATDTEATQELIVETTPAEVLDAEALSPDNCMAEGSAVATIFVSGRMPLDFKAEGPDGDPISIQRGYLSGYTESGIAEFQMENIPIKIYACEDGVTDTATTGAVTEQDDTYTLNFNRMKYPAVAPDKGYMFVPTDYTQVQSANNSLAPGTAKSGEQRLYWPVGIEFQPSPDVTDESIKAINEFMQPYVDPEAENKVPKKSVTSTYKAAVASLLAQAGLASEGSQFNERCTIAGDWKNIAEVIKEGTKQRVAGDASDVGRTGAVHNIGGDTYNKNVSVDMLSLPETRTDWFDITACNVYVGDANQQSGPAVGSSLTGGSN